MLRLKDAARRLVRSSPRLESIVRAARNSPGAQPPEPWWAYDPYSYGVEMAARQAARLGLSGFTAIEFGVAGGNGLLRLEASALRAAAEHGVKASVVGFDLGSGCLSRLITAIFLCLEARLLRYERRFAAPKNERPVGLWAMSERPVPDYRPRLPVGFVSVDLDYWSSTTAALRLFDLPDDFLMPRVVCYFDDVTGPHEEFHCQHVGELLAIAEFNKAHSNRKIEPIHGLAEKLGRFVGWDVKVFAFHSFQHAQYNTYVFAEPDRQERLEPLVWWIRSRPDVKPCPQSLKSATKAIAGSYLPVTDLLANRLAY